MIPSPNTFDTTKVQRALACYHTLCNCLLHTHPPSNISHPACFSLLCLIDIEFCFLSCFSSPFPHPIPNSLSTNLDYLKSVVRVVPYPSVLAISCIYKPLCPSSHVDIVAAFRHAPTWFLVFDHNSYHFPWLGPKGLRNHIECVIVPTLPTPLPMPPSFSTSLAYSPMKLP